MLLHDSLGCVELWRDVPARLAAASGREVVAYDRLGFGRSDPHPGALGAGFVVEEAAGGLRAVCDALRLERFVVFGHSVGGGMAVAAAALHRQRCTGLISESAQAFVEDRTRAGILAAREAFAQPQQMQRLRKYHGDKAPWVLGAWIDTWLSDAFAGWNLDAQLAQVICPTLVVHGDAAPARRLRSCAASRARRRGAGPRRGVARIERGLIARRRAPRRRGARRHCVFFTGATPICDGDWQLPGFCAATAVLACAVPGPGPLRREK
ncbi:alpha/beta fold hydrolase [Lysobacter enzymogenes]|uniref:alpha/beta fold hydrolase n=1 Tax=Lysobacter enzymogenes TaxID=69 RepID=UPI001F0C3977|nr:alpha/beta fold hydrolase [Lysobacter enzymogenes]